MSITVVFDPPLPSDNPATFNSKAFTLLGNLNTWSTQANALATEINQDEAALNDAVNAAATSALNAATSASNAAASATNALNSANAASASAAAAANSFDAFDDRYLGAKASDPTTDNDGNALITGALYWNTSANEMRVWNGSSWQVAVGALVGNADTATKLQTARTINGTSFDGSANITTAKWGAARTITIGNTGKSVDGSANVSWSLAEIGAVGLTGDETIGGNKTFSGEVTNFSAIGARITGEFSNAIHAKRLLFQTSTTNGNTAVGAIPNGTGNIASFVAWNGSDASNASYVQMVAATDARFISGATGTGTLLPMAFWTGGAERMRIDTSGNVHVTSNTGALGYGTGTGGSVTQGSSNGKATAVTLNRPTGQITMNNGALAAGASVLFTLNNSVILFNDLLLMGTTGGGNYRVDCVDVSNGGAAIRVTNISGDSLSDALVIRFAIIRGVTS